MTAVAQLFTTGGSQAVRLPRGFRFPGQTVRLRRTSNGVRIAPVDDLGPRCQRFMKLAGACLD